MKDKYSAQELYVKYRDNRNNLNFKHLLESINWMIRKIIHDIVQDNEATDAVYSRTVESIYCKFDTYDESKSKFSTWCGYIARNWALQYKMSFNKNKVDSDISDIELGEVLYEEYDPTIDDMYNATLDCIQYLTEEEQCIINELNINEITLKEYEAKYDIPHSTLINRVYKARAKLARIVKQHYPELYLSYKHEI